MSLKRFTRTGWSDVAKGGANGPVRAAAVLALAGALVACGFLLTSCASLSGAQAYRQAQPYYLTDDVKLPLLDTRMLPSAREGLQHIKGSYNGKTYFIDTYVKAGPDEIDMIGLDAMGSQLFDLELARGKGIRFTSALGMTGIKPEYILADYQLAYYPFEAVRSFLAGYGFDFVQRDDAGVSERILSRKGRELLKIETLEKGLRYTNELRGYSYEITESE